MKQLKIKMTRMGKKVIWGGRWTDEKLNAFEDYVKAYLRIMNPRRDKYDWSLCYFDGFAGNGTRTAEDRSKEVAVMADLFGEDLTQDELYVYKGAAERVVRIEEQGIKGFDTYFFIDKDEGNISALKEHLSQFSYSGQSFFHARDANDALDAFARWMKARKGRKSIVFLDPFGMQINWSSIQELKGLDIDLWILIPTGVIVNRLLRREYVEERGLLHTEKLESFFGLTEDEIKQAFYREVREDSLFSEEKVKIVKLEDPIRRIAELYVRQLHTVFPEVTRPMVLESSRGCPLFHFVFASRNATGKKIAQYIINRQKQ